MIPEVVTVIRDIILWLGITFGMPFLAVYLALLGPFTLRVLLFSFYLKPRLWYIRHASRRERFSSSKR